MTYRIEIDEFSLEQTAQALKAMNHVSHSADYMRSRAKAVMCDGSTTLGTGGWEAAGYFPTHRQGVMVVRFAVSAYGVNKYLEGQTA